jgi:hypothetical protein
MATPLVSPGRRLAGTLLAAALCALGCVGAHAQVALSEAELRTPWEQHLLVLKSLSGPVGETARGPQREALADHLARLQVSLGEYETQVDEVIDRIISDAQFAFVAAETSAALSEQLAEVHGRFDALYSALGVRDRADATAAQSSLGTLRNTLAARTAFETDVMRVRASASRQETVALATRWWKGEEQAIAVKKLVAELRQKLEGLPIDERAR